MRFLCYLISAATLLAQTEAAPDARRLLIRSGGAALLADTVRMEGRESTEVNIPGSHQTIETSFSLWRSGGGRMRLEAKVGEVRGLIVSDSASTWLYNSQSNTYTQSPASSGPGPDGFSKLKFSRDPAGFHDAKVEREESLPFGGKAVLCYVVRASYNTMPGTPLARDIVRTVWIAQTGDVVLRDSWEFSISMPGTPVQSKSHLTTDYTLVEWDVPLSDDLFTFHPPEGSRAITTGPPAASARPAAPSRQPLREVQPEYSPEARAAGLQGTVSLYVESDEDGRATRVQVMQGLGLGLDEKALEALGQWQFDPKGARSGREVLLQFRLDRPAPWQVAREVYLPALPSRQHHGVLRKPGLTHYSPPSEAACSTESAAIVDLIVGADGLPRQVRVARAGAGAMGAAAAASVQSWQFQPATQDGAPIEARGEVELVCQPGGMRLTSEAPELPVYRVGGGVSAPRLESKVEPEYSEEARREKLEGSNSMYVQIAPDGTATKLQMARSLGLGLDERAMEAVKRWRFTPGMKDGKPVTVEATIEVNFKLL